jgi:hypothetical protein
VMLAPARAAKKKTLAEDITQLKASFPNGGQGWKKRMHAYIYRGGTLEFNPEYWDEDDEALNDALYFQSLWLVRVRSTYFYYLTKDEATAGAVALLLEGLATKIIHRRR